RETSTGSIGIAGSERGSRTPTAPLGSRGPQGGRSPCVQERMDPSQVLRPKPIEPVEVSLLDALREAPVVHPRDAMARLREQALQCGVVHLSHDMVIEHGLVAAIED